MTTVGADFDLRPKGAGGMLFDESYRVFQISGFDVVRHFQSGLGKVQTFGKPGRAEFWVVLHNGLRRKTTVLVTDYARPAKFTIPSNWGPQRDHVKHFLTTQREAICEVTAYFVEHRMYTESGQGISLDEDGELTNVPPGTSPEIRQTLKDMLYTYPYDLTIRPSGQDMIFQLVRNDAAGNWLDWEVHYSAYDYLAAELAPHWHVHPTTSGPIY